MTSQGQDKHTNMTSELDNETHIRQADTYNIKYIERWMLALRSPSFTQGQRVMLIVLVVLVWRKLISGYGDGMECGVQLMEVARRGARAACSLRDGRMYRR